MRDKYVSTSTVFLVIPGKLAQLDSDTIVGICDKALHDMDEFVVQDILSFGLHRDGIAMEICYICVTVHDLGTAQRINGFLRRRLNEVVEQLIKNDEDFAWLK
jgi:hypothetical protein